MGDLSRTALGDVSANRRGQGSGDLGTLWKRGGGGSGSRRGIPPANAPILAGRGAERPVGKARRTDPPAFPEGLLVC